MQQDYRRQDQEGRPTAVRIVLAIGLITLLVGIGFAAGMATMWFMGTSDYSMASSSDSLQPAAAAALASPSERYGLLDEIWTLLHSEYIDVSDLDAQDLIYGAADGMVASVGDAHTMFVEPVQAAILEQDMQGSFEGIGATVDLVDGVLTIVQPLPNSPAVRAGIQAGDQVLAVDGQSLEGMDLLDSITLIRGPQGTRVELLISRQSIPEPFSVTVTRERVQLEIVQTRMLEGNIGYLALAEFNAVSARQVQEGLRTLLRDRPVGLILDLRNNPGGYLHMAIEVASEFLPRGTVVVTEQQRDQGTTTYSVRRNGLATRIPLVVLVNGGSASASEIVAGAIQDHERGVLVGDTTFGKGSVQSTHTLSDGSSLRVTIAKWVLPDGRILDGDGLTPDMAVSITPEDVTGGVDPQLDSAIEYLLEATR